MTATMATDRIPAVAVIVTCYDLGRYLDEAVASVRAQTFRDYALAIVDDGSTDKETLDRLSAHEQQGAYVIRSPNRGLPAARNLGIAHTRSRYVCSVDADDVLEPTLLEQSVAVLERDPSIAFVSHWLRTFGDETWDWTPTDCGLPALLDINTVNGAALVRREVLEAIGGFDETMRSGCEDWDLWISIVQRGFPGMILPEFLFRYRRRRASMSRVMLDGDTHPKLYRRIVEKHADSFRRHLPQLLLRRERHVAHLQRQIQDLEWEQSRWLLPELAKRRDDVAVLERREERDGRWRALTADVDRLQDDLDRTRRSLTASESALTATESALAENEAARRAAEDQSAQAMAGVNTAIARAYELDARVNRAEASLDDLRRSWSWRLTAPLRSVVDAVRGRARREP